MAPPFLSAGFAAPPRTPEPGASYAATDTDAPLPSPPSPPRRLRLKRRAAPRLSAPTQNFLASVAAADVPLPSIEVPDHNESTDMQPHFFAPDSIDTMLLSVQGRDNKDNKLLSVQGRPYSPPKTPAPGTAPSASSSSTSAALPSRYPDWSVGSVFSSSTESSPDPEYNESSRPSTARSTRTSSSSLFSRFSQLSDDDNCLSPGEDGPSKMSAGLSSRLSSHAHELRRNSATGGLFASSSSSNSSSNPVVDSGDDSAKQRRRARKPALTKAMSAHLWATYILYLQDPKVTPFRVGKSCVPPHGVLTRVAREAKRSWKGARAVGHRVGRAVETSTTATATATAAPAAVPAVVVHKATAAAGTKSGSSTPTPTDANGTFMEWPFTNAATRAHLRDLCRRKAAAPGGGARGLQYMSRSPTPFTAATARWGAAEANAKVPAPEAPAKPANPPTQANAPAPANAPASTFATKDMALSLVLSTAESMQPHGPLAQLTRVGRDRAYSSYSSTNAHVARSAHRPHRSLGSHLFHSGGPPPSFEASLAAAMDAAAASASSSTAMATAKPKTKPDIGEDASLQSQSQSLSQSQDRRRLGSPFTARSYGPSSSSTSSSSLAAVLGLAAANTRPAPHTVGPRRSLQSPVRISRSSTQRTRRTKHLSQDLRRRPGLGTDFFTEPAAFSSFGFPGPDNDDSTSTATNTTTTTARTASLTSSSSAPQLAASVARSEADVTPAELDDPFCSTDAPPAPPTLAPAPARLGSPFITLPETSTSFSFPNRMFSSAAAANDPDMHSMLLASRPFATVQRVAQPKPAAAGGVRSDLASRLAYLDQRLREINGGGVNSRRRSESP